MLSAQQLQRSASVQNMASSSSASDSVVLSSQVSNEIMNEVARKREIAGGKRLLEITRQAPPPSKDYMQVLVTEGGVILRMIPITIRGVTQGAVPAPSEKVLSLEEFFIDLDFQGEITRAFGSEILKQVRRAASGKWDIFLRLPEDLVIRIVILLDLQSIARLALVNQHMREVCGSEKLWARLYRIHQGEASEEVSALAGEIGWKAVFFMNKLQLQKELSRRRKAAPDQQLSTFLTES